MGNWHKDRGHFPVFGAPVTLAREIEGLPCSSG